MNDFPRAREQFVARFGGVFEHSPWIAEQAWDSGLVTGRMSAEGLHKTMMTALRAASEETKLKLINAHPDLAGRLALAGRLTADSTKEQASAGLAYLTEGEKARFTALNEAYKAKFGFPFIMAVKGRTKNEILAAFETRIAHDRATEFTTALAEIEKITLMRLRDMLPD
jgi:OHCU decarboxylase